MGEPHVLVVDDEPNIRETVSFILEMEGFRVTTAGNGVEALEIIERLRPEVIVLDAMLPKRDGFEVCRIIKSTPEFAGACVVMLTALGQRVDRERAIEAGADHFVTKPFDEEQLLALLRGIVRTDKPARRPGR